MATRSYDVWRYMIYDAFGKLVAEYGVKSEGLGGVKYVQSDWQGSVRTVTNSNGFVVARNDYQAFGGEVGYGVGTRSIEQGYSVDKVTKQSFGLTEEDSTGQKHAWARKLETESGRWTRPDPYNGSMNLSYPQSLNRYSYVTNDPINFVDPDGLDGISSIYSVFGDQIINLPGFGTMWGSFSVFYELQHEDAVGNARGGNGYATNARLRARAGIIDVVEVRWSGWGWIFLSTDDYTGLDLSKRIRDAGVNTPLAPTIARVADEREAARIAAEEEQASRNSKANRRKRAIAACMRRESGARAGELNRARSSGAGRTLAWSCGVAFAFTKNPAACSLALKLASLKIVTVDEYYHQKSLTKARKPAFGDRPGCEREVDKNGF